MDVIYTVKPARMKLPADAVNFSCCLHVNKTHTQFTCVACSLLVKTVNLPTSTQQAAPAEYTRIACSRK